MNSLLDFIGKFHPLLLHLPIGVLVYVYLHLFYDVIIKKKDNPVNVKFALGVGAISAVLSALSGYLLSLNGEYSGDILDWHKWLGIGTAAGASLLYWSYVKGSKTKSFLMWYTLFMMLLTITGHYGGSLTHGEDFLSISDHSDSDKIQIVDINQADIFQHLIMPIAERKCMSCHNPSKAKGDLVLNTVDDWIRGGKNGSFLLPRDKENSLISLRAHLPLEDKEHMPPSGKIQLDADELVLIDWWISKMDHFAHKLEELTPPAHIMKYIQAKLDYSTVGVPELFSEDILDLQSKGIPAYKISEEKPWLAIQFNRGDQVGKKDIDAIRSLDENVRELKMSKVGLLDNIISKLLTFKNLKTLDISLNKLSTKGVVQLKELEKLESLNLYGTKVDSEILEHLAEFESLENIYLWQTDINEEDLKKANIPKTLSVNIGQDLSVFGEVQLTPPSIFGSTDIFVDTLQISLSHQGKKSKIRYTIDGSLPTENSPIYNAPIVLDHTAMVRATASMEGWNTSEVAEESFLKSSFKIISCAIDPAPNEKYAADGSMTIIDHQKASSQFADGKWLGFSAQDVSIILDLGEVGEINAVSFGSLRDYRSYIFNPIGAKISFSIDGKSFDETRQVSYPQITKPEDNLVKNIIIEVPNSKARYIKLEILAQKKNPEWHPSPGADCWLFIDEIVVE